MAAGGAVAAGWRSSHHPAHTGLSRPSCGSALTHFLTSDTQLLHADPGALGCFVRAVRDCKHASLGVTAMGVDTGTDYVFTVQPGSASCRVIEQRQAYSANFGGSKGALVAVPCRRIAVTRAGVTLSCRGQRVLIPATVSGTAPHPA